MDFASAIIREGDRVTASGRLVRNETGDWFEPPVPVAGPFSLFRSVRPAWPGSVRIVGADFGAELTGRFERAGAVEGFATLTGTWAADRLQVERQDLYARQQRKIPNWTVPPCPPPEGGWPHQTWVYGIKDVQTGERPAAQYVSLEYDLGDLREAGAVVITTTFRPSEDQAVLVVAAADPEAVEAHLRPQLGPLLCVIPSKWSRGELEAVRAHLHAHHDDWNLCTWGDTSTEDGQPLITARLTRILPEIATWAASLPAGILGLEPWLTRGQPHRESLRVEGAGFLLADARGGRAEDRQIAAALAGRGRVVGLADVQEVEGVQPGGAVADLVTGELGADVREGGVVVGGGCRNHAVQVVDARVDCGVVGAGQANAN
jgi:hypothetical protein